MKRLLNTANSILKRNPHLLPLLFLAIIIILFNYPFIIGVTSHKLVYNPLDPARSRDIWHFIWNFWWIRESLLNGTDIFYTNLMFYPEGVSLVWHTLDIFDGLLWSFFNIFMDDIAAFNTVILLNFILSGVFMHLLCFHVTGNRSASFIGGLIFAIFPQHIWQAVHGHLNLIGIGWLALYLLVALKIESKKFTLRFFLKNIIVVLTILAIITLKDLQLLFFASILTLVLLARNMAKNIKFIAMKRTIKGVLENSGQIIVIVLGWILMFAILSPYLVRLIDEATLFTLAIEREVYRLTRNSLSLSQLIVPIFANPFFGNLTKDFFLGLSQTPGFGASQWFTYIGYTTIFLCFIPFFLRDENTEKKFFAIISTLFILLSFGPSFRVFPFDMGYLDYYMLFTMFPEIKIFRCPARYQLVAFIGLSVLASVGYKALEQKIEDHLPKKKKLTVMLISIFILSITAEYGYQNLPLKDAEISPVYEIIKESPESSAVLELPTSVSVIQKALYAQTYHHKPLINGKVAQRSLTLAEDVKWQPFIKLLTTCQTKDIFIPAYDDVKVAPLTLSKFDIKFIVVHKDAYANKKVLDRKLNYLYQALGPPSVETKKELLFILKEKVDVKEFSMNANSITVLPSYGWEEIRVLKMEKKKIIYRLLYEANEVEIYTPREESYIITFKLLNQKIPKGIRFQVNGDEVDQNRVIKIDRSTVKINVIFKEGRNTFSIETEKYPLQVVTFYVGIPH